MAMLTPVSSQPIARALIGPPDVQGDDSVSAIAKEDREVPHATPDGSIAPSAYILVSADRDLARTQCVPERPICTHSTAMEDWMELLRKPTPRSEQHALVV